MSIKNGQKPLSAKKQIQPASLNADDIFGNPVGVEPEMRKCIEDKGYVLRWVNAVKLASGGGYHQKMWKPIPRETLKEWGYGKMDTFSFTFGNDPEGYVRRGDLVLAVRPKELHEKHKALLKQERERVSTVQTQKKHSEELKSILRDSGVENMIHDTFEDETKE